MITYYFLIFSSHIFLLVSVFEENDAIWVEKIIIKISHSMKRKKGEEILLWLTLEILERRIFVYEIFLDQEFQGLFVLIVCLTTFSRSQQCMDADGNQVLFAVKKGTDSTVFWKGTIRIAVIRKNIQSSDLETSKLLNLSQFLKVGRQYGFSF